MALSDEEQVVLEQRLDGWIAGLHLASLAMQGHEPPGEVLARFTASQRSLFDYFAEEVFARQPEAVQRFLLSTAVLTELTPSLCAAMYDDHGQEGSEACARSLLDTIARQSLSGPAG